jgi:GDPmannose 4,6-dehydratase
VTPSTQGRKALIFGVSGQDGAYLAQFLLARGYHVTGTSRSPTANHPNLQALGLQSHIRVIPCDMQDCAQLRVLLDRVAPDEIYNLAGQTSVSRSFQQPLETVHSIAHANLNLLEAIRHTGAITRLFHASSAECFGDHGCTPVTESTPFRPRSPYGVAKASAHLQVACYRDAFGLFACSGILFNHESPLRPQTFVTQKVIAHVGAIARGSTARLHVGNIDVFRDWGWAPEYVEAMWLMLQQPTPNDFLIATGESHSLRDFIELAFAAVGRSSEGLIIVDKSLLRPTEIRRSYADPGKIERDLGWSAQLRISGVIRLMLQADDTAHKLPVAEA